MYNNYSKFQKNQKAVALAFDQNKDIAPKVLALGSGIVAEHIIQIAKEHNIPIKSDTDLVEILSVLNINEYIPIEIYAVVAEIFINIYKLNK